jgi:alkanesulfonate monooxygenase SsuD/methylene tetrahydromethanopterin reductase-like flavin-dependent oxidoreductase (luciferase family)
LTAGGDADRYEIPLIFYTCVAPTRVEARHAAVDALQRYLVHQHHDADGDHIVQRLEERDQLWFGAPGDLIRLIERYQADVDNRHFVFWLDFGGVEPGLVRRSMQLLAQEVIPHFKKTLD